MSHEFFVGQRVVCVDASLTPRYTPYPVAPNDDLDGLQERAIYTVRRVGVVFGVAGLWLEEIHRRGLHPDSIEEPCFAAARFRPLRERKTDISIFRAILNGHRVPEGV